MNPLFIIAKDEFGKDAAVNVNHIASVGWIGPGCSKVTVYTNASYGSRVFNFDTGDRDHALEAFVTMIYSAGVRK